MLSVVLLLLAPQLAPAATSLDATGVLDLMASPQVALVKFVSGLPDEVHSLNGLWERLDADFARSGIMLASVDCKTSPDACKGRKIDPSSMPGPIVKFWGGAGESASFRRYAGAMELQPLREYLSKKLVALTAAQKALLLEQAQRAQMEQGPPPPQQQQRQQRSQRSDRRTLPDAPDVNAVILWVFECFIYVSVLCTIYYAYLSRPLREAPADFALLSCGGESNSASLSLLRVDPVSGELTPVSRVPCKGTSPASLCLAASVEPAGTRVVVYLVDATAGGDTAPRLRHLALDVARTPCLVEVANTTVKGVPPACKGLLPLRVGPERRKHVRQDSLIYVGCDGSAATVEVLSTLCIPSPDPPALVGLYRRWMNRGSHPANVSLRAVPNEPKASVGSQSLEYLALSIPETATKVGDGTTAHLLTADPASDVLSLSVFSPKDGAKARSVGVLRTAKGAAPVSLAAHPFASLAYVLCAGDGSVLVCELLPDKAPSLVQRLSLSKGATPPGCACLCASGDGMNLYALLGSRLFSLAIGNGGRKLNLIDNFVASGRDAGDANRTGVTSAPLLTLAGSTQAILLVALPANDLLLSFRRRADNGKLEPAKELRVEDPKALTAFAVR